MKRKLSLLLAMILALGMMSFEIVAAYADYSVIVTKEDGSPAVEGEPSGADDYTINIRGEVYLNTNNLTVSGSVSGLFFSYLENESTVTINGLTIEPSSTSGIGIGSLPTGYTITISLVGDNNSCIGNFAYPGSYLLAGGGNNTYILGGTGKIKLSSNYCVLKRDRISSVKAGKILVSPDQNAPESACEEISCDEFVHNNIEYKTAYIYGTDALFGSVSGSDGSSHVHSFTWQTIYEATPNSDGLEGEVCSCGATRNTQSISAMDYAINKYANQMIKAAKPGQKITLEFGEFNSFPRYMMEKVAARMNENITFVFKFKQNKKMQTVTIEPGTAIDLQYDWYGPDKMKELYGAE